MFDFENKRFTVFHHFLIKSRFQEKKMKPAKIGNSTYAVPADPVLFFYYSLGVQKIDRIIEFQEIEVEGRENPQFMENQQQQNIQQEIIFGQLNHE